MSDISQIDKINFPGGYDIGDIIIAVTLGEKMHVGNAEMGETESAVLQRFFVQLAARHPESLPFRDPFQLRAKELFEERRSLLNSHLRFSWFELAYWGYGLLAVRSGLSTAQFDNLSVLLTPVERTLRELGVRVSDQECLAEIDRFVPSEVTARSVKAATYLYLSFVRFLHFGALRRRETVPPHLIVPSVCLAFTDMDAEEAHCMSTFLTAHGISLTQRPAEFTQAGRLLVLLSHYAIGSDLFWRNLEHWKERGAMPMVVCLMPKAELYREPPTDWRSEMWTWLSANVAVELSSAVDRYVTLLRALDSRDPKDWWWNKGDAIELGLAVDVLGLGIPRPQTPPEKPSAAGEPYPFQVDGSLFAACFFASDRLTRTEKIGEDRYLAMCLDLARLRQKPNGEPYGMPWFILIYRTWLAFAAQLTGFTYSEQEIIHAEQETQQALFALGIGTVPSEVAAFLEAFASVPWTTHPLTLAAVDERTIAFLVLVYRLSQAALTRTQRMRLRHPCYSAFISYARPDEGFARELVAHLEAQGADIWWDLNSITLGTPLKGALRSAVRDARYLLLIATPAADKSAYVRLEVEAAIRNGLRVVPIVLTGQMPPGLEALLENIRDASEPIISATDSERRGAMESAFARLIRSPSEQLHWLQSQASYQNLCKNLAEARAVPSRSASSPA